MSDYRYRVINKHRKEQAYQKSVKGNKANPRELVLSEHELQIVGIFGARIQVMEVDGLPEGGLSEDEESQDNATQSVFLADTIPFQGRSSQNDQPVNHTTPNQGQSTENRPGTSVSQIYEETTLPPSNENVREPSNGTDALENSQYEN